MRAVDSLALDGGYHHVGADQATSTSSCMGICMALSSTRLMLVLYNKRTQPQQICQYIKKVLNNGPGTGNNCENIGYMFGFYISISPI